MVIRSICLALTITLPSCETMGPSPPEHEARAWTLVEVALFDGSGPAPPGPGPRPEPGRKCDACNGTGRSGDGLGPCGFCGGDGVTSSDWDEPSIPPLTPLPESEEQPPALVWHDSWEDTMAAAREEKHHVLVVGSGKRSECPPCKAFEDNVLADPEVREYLAGRMECILFLCEDVPVLQKLAMSFGTPFCIVYSWEGEKLVPEPKPWHPDWENPDAFIRQLSDRLGFN